MTSPPRLTDTQLASFERDGFLRIDALTDTAEVEVLLGLYDESTNAAILLGISLALGALSNLLAVFIGKQQQIDGVIR